MATKNNEVMAPTPQHLEKIRQQKIKEGIGFDDVLRYLSLGVSPTAPRLPESAMQYGSQFGGYPKGFSNRIGAKGSVNFSTLRQVGKRSPVLSAIVSTRLHQATRFARKKIENKKHSVGFRIRHKNSDKKDFREPEGFENLILETSQMILKPWRVFWDEGTVFKEVEPNLPGVISKIVEDMLIINRPVVELGLDPLRVPRSFGVIDGANIIPTFAALKFLTTQHRDIPKEWEHSHQQYRRVMQLMADRYQIDMDENTEYLYMLNGRPAAAFRVDELIVAPQFPSSDVNFAGYPASLTERAIFIILSEILAMTANTRFFEFGSMAEILVTMRGNYDDKHVKDLESILKGNMSGVQGMHRVPLVAMPGGKDDIDVVQLKNNHRDMLFDVYIQKLTNLACAVFRMHPSEINEAPRAGDNSGSLNQSSQVQQIGMAQEQGLESTLDHIGQAIFNPMIERIHPDLCFEWDYGENEQEKINLITSRATYTTVNERRAMDDMDPIPDEEGGNIIDNTFIQQDKQMKQQQEQQQQMMQQQGGEGGPSENEEEEPTEDQEGSEGSEGDEENSPKEKKKKRPSYRDEEEGESNANEKGRKGKKQKVDYESESPEERIERLLGKFRPRAISRRSRVV